MRLSAASQDPKHVVEDEPQRDIRVVQKILGLDGGLEDARLEGEILPGGADWQVVRSDGVVELVARYAIRTTDGVEIAVVNRGLRRAAPDVMQRMARGEAVDPALVYCRTTPHFEAPAGPYEWLNRSVFVASAERRPNLVRIAVSEVL